jgi:hypothetical protein
MSNEKKSATLGMPHGTAAHRLRKMILFDLLKRHNENVCVRCSGLIETVEELSVEHIKPWEGISAELFWDLQNVAFSHTICNYRSGFKHGGTPKRKIGLEGTAWCRVHQKFEPIENFYKNGSRWNGLQKDCKESRPDRVSVGG